MTAIERWTCSRCYADHVGFTVCQSCGVTRANRGFTKRWILHPCPVCGDAARCRCGLAECGHHGEREAVEVVPADQLAGVVHERDVFARAFALAVAPELREAYVQRAKDALARQSES